MKSRDSLISNSSSTSFIIAYKTERCKCCGRTSGCIAEKIEHKNDINDDYRIHAKGVEDIKKDLEGWFADSTKEDIIQKLDKLPPDLEVIYCSISHHDTDMINEIESIEQFGGQIIYRGEG